MNVAPKVISVIRALYNNSKFMVEIDGVASEWYLQRVWIRQGCPLSPYLFVVLMTVMFEDAHRKLGNRMGPH